MKFSDAYEAYGSDIKVSALSQRVPGLDYDDVVNEMLVCLWRATKSFDRSKGATFGSYWWSLWLNRRSDIAEQWYAAKRVHPLLTDDMSVVDAMVEAESSPPEAPLGSSDHERLVWDLLAVGETATDTMTTVGMSRRRYYSTVGKWRTDAVHQMLRQA